MFGRGLVKQIAATAVVAGSAFVVVIALGATLYFALSLAMPGLGAAALTAGVFAVLAALVARAYLAKAGGDEPDDVDEAPMGLGARAYTLFRQRPILGTAAALAGGFIFLRNPALATMVAAAFTERSHGRRR